VNAASRELEPEIPAVWWEEYTSYLESRSSRSARSQFLAVPLWQTASMPRPLPRPQIAIAHADPLIVRSSPFFSAQREGMGMGAMLGQQQLTHEIGESGYMDAEVVTPMPPAPHGQKAGRRSRIFALECSWENRVGGLQGPRPGRHGSSCTCEQDLGYSYASSSASSSYSSSVSSEESEDEEAGRAKETLSHIQPHRRPNSRHKPARRHLFKGCAATEEPLPPRDHFAIDLCSLDSTLLGVVLANLPPSMPAAVSRTCRAFSEAVRGNEQLWRRQCEDLWRHKHPHRWSELLDRRTEDAPLQAGVGEDVDWHAAFKASLKDSRRTEITAQEVKDLGWHCFTNSAGVGPRRKRVLFQEGGVFHPGTEVFNFVSKWAVNPDGSVRIGLHVHLFRGVRRETDWGWELVEMQKSPTGDGWVKTESNTTYSSWVPLPGEDVKEFLKILSSASSDGYAYDSIEHPPELISASDWDSDSSDDDYLPSLSASSAAGAAGAAAATLPAPAGAAAATDDRDASATALSATAAYTAHFTSYAIDYIYFNGPPVARD